MSLQYILIHTVVSVYNTKTLDTINLKGDVTFFSSKPAKHYSVHYIIILSEKYIFDIMIMVIITEYVTIIMKV